MGGYQIGLLGARCLGLARKPRVRWLEIAHVDARCALGSLPSVSFRRPAMLTAWLTAIAPIRRRRSAAVNVPRVRRTHSRPPSRLGSGSAR